MAVIVTRPNRPTATARAGFGNTILPATSFDVDRNLWERVSSESPGQGGVSWSDATEVMVFDVDYAYDYDAILTILGYAYVDYAHTVNGQPTLFRVNPLRHPRRPWLFASSIDSIKYMGPRGKEQSAPNPDLYPTQPSFRAEYKISRISVTFKPLPFSVDGTANGQGSEELRYVSKRSSASAEFITREGGANWKFVDGVAAGKPLPTQPFALSENKVTYNWTWNYVPEEFVCQSPGDPPLKWYQNLNQLNALPFAGQPIWTFLHLPFTYERRPMPTMTANGVQNFYLNITSNWLYFNPKNTAASAAARDLYGHNLAPYAGDGWQYHFFTGPTDATGANAGTAAGTPRYKDFVFDNLFTYVTA